jgi:predicted RND superfamily exporter protein
MWYRLGRFILRFRVVLLLILIVLTGVMVFFATKVQMSYEFAKAIPSDNPKFIAFQHLEKNLGMMET